MVSSNTSSDRQDGHRFPQQLACGSYSFDFSKRTYLMGILNVTPDSFSDGGRFFDHAHALDHARRMVDEGADIIDVGGESTRPGAQGVSLEEERSRVLPILERLAHELPVPFSIDTTKATIAREAIEAGAVIINDISALRAEPEMAELAARHGVAVVLMHMRGTPRTMQQEVAYPDLIAEIYDFLQERIDYALSAGVDASRIMIDPGLGFGKSVPDGNLSILKHLGSFRKLRKPLLVGPSRKAFIGRVLGLGREEREEGTAAAVAIAVANGANVVRVHDVKMMKRVVAMADAVRSAS